MRYFKKGSDEFLENGKSLVRLGKVLSMPSPTQRGRTVKIFEVVQVQKLNPLNPISRGTMIALSFPNEHFNANEYRWRKDEEWFLPMEVKDRGVTVDSINRKAKEIRKQQAAVQPQIENAIHRQQ